MPDAYLDTTILADALLKPGSVKMKRAVAALRRYKTTLLPVYAIKELKAGPLDHYAYVHDKLALTRSFAGTMEAIHSLSPLGPGKKGTSYEALIAAFRQAMLLPSAGPRDEAKEDAEMADRCRLAIAALIVRAWRRRRRLATKTVGDLDCYTEAEPRVGDDGLMDLSPQRCDGDRECCLAAELKSQPGSLRAMRSAIPEGSLRAEDRRRRKALKQLINSPKKILDRGACVALGDAVFAFFCPPGAVVLTTNIKDHAPLAEALGKIAERP